MTTKPQDELFQASEGDAWFRRNQSVLTPRSADHDVPLLLLAAYPDLRPARVLEVGCSNGWRLKVLQERYGARAVGIEPSAEAISAGRSQFPDLDLRRGTAAQPPPELEGVFDLVVVNFVLHWVARETLLSSVAAIDQRVADGGHLLIGDFSPDAPVRRPYHHLPDQGVFTYKQGYAELFVASCLYRAVATMTFNHDAKQLSADVPSGERASCTLLQKSLHGRYGA